VRSFQFVAGNLEFSHSSKDEPLMNH